MGDFAVIRPKEDSPTRQSSDWCDMLVNKLTAAGHSLVNDVDDYSPADAANIDTALRGGYQLVFYFGHGEEDKWLTNSQSTFDAGNASSANGKTIVSIACKTGCKLGPDAITAGAVCWLGFTIKVPVLAPHNNIDPLGDGLVTALAGLASSQTMQYVQNALVAELARLVVEYDRGSLQLRPEATIAYFALMALRDHVVVHGNAHHSPL